MSFSPIKPLFTAKAMSTGGRNGTSKAEDGSVAVTLSVPKEMGGPGRPGTTTPEHLFATGYAACFCGALDFTARQHQMDATGAEVTCAVSIGPREGGGFGIAVRMAVRDTKIPTADLRKLVAQAHADICPYSHATRDNVDIQFDVEGA